MRIIMLTVCLLVSAAYGEDKAAATPTFRQEELPGYQFDRVLKEDPAIIQDLSIGQQFILDAQRQEMKDLISRRLGIVNVRQSVNDLRTIQQLVDRKIIQRHEVGEWQALGILFGDILVNEYGLHWVSYRDRLGTSKALRWKKTENYVFPVTMFSRRVQFKEKIDVAAMFEKIGEEVIAFKKYERRNLRI